MNQLDLDLKNYDYYELLKLFKIDNTDNRNNILYKIDKTLNNLIDKKIDDYVVNFFKKAKNIIIAINDLLNNNSPIDIEPFMNKIYKIDKTDNIALLSVIDLLNKIRNVELAESIPLVNKNEVNYNVNKMDYILKNNTNTVFNVATNELSPGDLN